MAVPEHWSWLACPACHGGLAVGEESLACGSVKALQRSKKSNA